MDIERTGFPTRNGRDTVGRFYPVFKPWGKTYRLPMPSGSEVHIAYIKKGGKSSFHLHENMVNVFFIVSGRLLVKLEYGDEVILGPEDVLPIETFNKHSFEALEDTVLVESYGQVDIHRIKVN